MPRAGSSDSRLIRRRYSSRQDRSAVHVRTRPPAFRDFLSPAATGRPAPGEPHIDRLWTAVSLWTSAEAARSRARRYPWLGRFIAVLEIDEWPGVRVEKTLGRGHVSAWADADALLGLVVDTIEVEE